MTVEREVKLRFPDASAARRAVEAIGAHLRRARHFEDNLLLDDPARRLAGAGTALRLRRAEGRGILTFKGPKQADPSGLKTRTEIEFDVSDPDRAQALLSALGYAPAFRYQKFREVWDWRDAEIVVDETPVGTFVEVEGSAESIAAAVRALGLGPADHILDSYPDLFRAAGGQGDMVF